MVDVEKLPPTQDLILDVLAARYRLGETLWPFSSRLKPALDALTEAGLIHVTHGNAYRTLRAGLTERGKQLVLGSGYTPPNGGFDRLRRAMEGVAEYAEARADLSIGMDAIAKTARQALRSTDA